jgi:hypothetical protein
MRAGRVTVVVAIVLVMSAFSARGASAAGGATGASATLGPAGGNTRVLTLTNKAATPIIEFSYTVLGTITNVRPSPACVIQPAPGGGEDVISCTETVNPGASVQVCFDGGEARDGGNVILPLREGPESVVELPETPAPAVSHCPLEAGSTTVSQGTGTAQKCVVPHVAGKKLASAEKAITKAHCAVGRVKMASSKHVKKGLVISESPAAGKSLPGGTKVNLTVSKGK